MVSEQLTVKEVEARLVGLSPKESLSLAKYLLGRHSRGEITLMPDALEYVRDYIRGFRVGYKDGQLVARIIFGIERFLGKRLGGSRTTSGIERFFGRCLGRLRTLGLLAIPITG